MIRDAVTPPGGDVAIETVRGDVQGAAQEPFREGQLPFERGVEVGVPGEQLARLACPEGLVVGVGFFVERTVIDQRVRDEI